MGTSARDDVPNEVAILRKGGGADGKKKESAKGVDYGGSRRSGHQMSHLALSSEDSWSGTLDASKSEPLQCIQFLCVAWSDDEQVMWTRFHLSFLAS